MIRRTLATLLVSAPAPIVLLAGPATAAEAPVTSTTPTGTVPTEPAPSEPEPKPEPEPDGSSAPNAPAEPAPGAAAPPAAPAPALPAPEQATPAAPDTPATTTSPSAPAGTLGSGAPEGKRKPRPQRTTGTSRLERPRPKRSSSASSPAPAGGAVVSGGAAAPAGGAEAPPGALSPLGPTAVGVPNFFIDSFRIPPFLLPIYQAAGVQYGIRWEVLAAINEIETDYGRNLNVSSAGALGWMQFMPATWRAYGVDANLDGEKDPFNPVDAIFAAARYLRAAGADEDLSKAIFAYNHADWYVRDVLRRAKLVAALPSDLVSSLSGLTQGIFPVGVPGDGDAASAGSLVPGTKGQRRLRIRAKSGAAATAVTDGTIVAMGRSERLGRYVRLRDAYGNVYTYGGLRSFATEVPVPKPGSTTRKEIRVELGLPTRDPSPRLAASTTGEAADPAPLPTATPALPSTATDAVDGASAARPAAASTTVVVAPPPRLSVRPPLPHGPSQASLDPAAAPAGVAEPAALPGAGVPVSSAPVPEPQIDSPAAVAPRPVPPPAGVVPPPGETPSVPAPETTATAPVDPGTATTPQPAATTPSATTTAPEQTTTSPPSIPPETATSPEPAATTPEPATTTPSSPAATTSEPPASAPEETATTPAPAPPASPAGVEEAREEADPVLDPLLPERQIELPEQPPVVGPAPSPAEDPSAERDDRPRVTDKRLADSFTVDYDLQPRDVTYVPLKRGRRVIAGTVLGTLGAERREDDDAGELGFEIRPAGDDTPSIDPRPIVRGWRLLESTALYRARAADVSGDTAVTIGQILLMDKQTLQRRVLNNDRIDLYSCGRRDVEAGIVDRRVLATLEFLAASDLRPTVTSLRCGHGVYTASGNVSHHTTGTAVDIAAINGKPILGNQGKGSVTDAAVRRLLSLQGTMKPAQIITLMKYEGTDNTFAMSDHHDHIHIGWRPGYEPRSETGQALESLLKPEQWRRLIQRLDKIENPKIPSGTSKHALKADKRADRLRKRGAGGSD